MTCAHAFVRTEELTSVDGGALTIIAGDDDGEELFLDADVCTECHHVELVIHGDATRALDALRREFADIVDGPCPRCAAPDALVDLGHSVTSQGGTEIHVPLDNRWTFGLLARACVNGHISLARVGGEPRPDAPRNAELLALHPVVATCACGGAVHAAAMESHHSGVITVDDHDLRAEICAACERVMLRVDR